MQTIKLFRFCLVAFLPISALAAPKMSAPDEGTLIESCSEFSQAGMRECLRGKANDSQQDLQQFEKEILNTLSQEGEDNKFLIEAKIKLATSSKVFANYRDVHCDFSASLSGGGNGRSIKYPACLAELNLRRMAQIRTVLTDFLLPPTTTAWDEFDERSLVEACREFSPARVQKCLQERAEDTLKMIQDLDKAVTSTLSRWDEEKHYITESKIKLAVSSKVFASYRDVHCDFAASLSRSSNDPSMVQPACIAELNHRRAIQLRKAMFDLDERAVQPEVASSEHPRLAIFAVSDALALGDQILRQTCGEAYTERRECLSANAKDSQLALQQAETQVANALSRRDKETQYVSEAKTKLAASNQSFVKYRDEQCGFAASSENTVGTDPDMGRLACVTELNYRRAAQLRETASKLQ